MLFSEGVPAARSQRRRHGMPASGPSRSGGSPVGAEEPAEQTALLLTVFQQVRDVQLQRREDLLKQLEVLPKPRHLYDETRRGLGKGRVFRTEVLRRPPRQPGLSQEVRACLPLRTPAGNKPQPLTSANFRLLLINDHSSSCWIVGTPTFSFFSIKI